ncbi:MAG: hypothetical protein IT367_20075 [Candidatus Hydrogenedentes bacterium]|nr:hypothetical protein [Candidatus Hydrogenedentota bacterium]
MSQLLENMSVIDTIIEILFPNESEFEQILINAVNHVPNWTVEHKRDLVIDLLRKRLSLHETASLRNTNATLMHQNADLTRENEKLRADLQTSQDEYNEVLEQRQALDGQITIVAERLAILEPQIENLIQFKAFVHGYLDLHGVPQGDPDNQHQKEGCRIGARLDLLLAERTKADRLQKYTRALQLKFRVAIALLTHNNLFHQYKMVIDLIREYGNELLTNNADGTTPPQNTKDQSTMSTQTQETNPTNAADQELPAPGANAGDTAQDCDKPKGFLGRAANRIGEAIDDVQRTVGLQANDPVCAPCTAPQPTPRKPIGELLTDIINAVTKVQEDTQRTFKVEVTIRDDSYSQGYDLKFTL